MIDDSSEDSFYSSSTVDMRNISISDMSQIGDETFVTTLTVKDSLKHNTFWKLYLMLILVMSFNSFIALVFKFYGF
jgi:hypothetical protein